MSTAIKGGNRIHLSSSRQPHLTARGDWAANEISVGSKLSP